MPYILFISSWENIHQTSSMVSKRTRIALEFLSCPTEVTELPKSGVIDGAGNRTTSSIFTDAHNVMISVVWNVNPYFFLIAVMSLDSRSYYLGARPPWERSFSATLILSMSVFSDVFWSSLAICWSAAMWSSMAFRTSLY